MPAMPEGVEPEGSAQGHVPVQGRRENGKAVVQLFGSGPILNEALRAQQILAEKYGVAADVWSVTSYNELRRDALASSAGTGCIRPSRRGSRTSAGAEGRGGADHRAPAIT